MDSSLNKDNLEKKLAEVEDWYRAVVFDDKAKVIASKNSSKADEKELS